MPRPKLHESSADRLRAWREKKRIEREAEKQREREAQEAQMQREREMAELHKLLRIAIGKALREEARIWHFPHHRKGMSGVTGAAQEEMREYAERLGQAMEEGGLYLPR